eukprot:CAMPEP_0176071412 /NCGR_PEP_ID=MMETSP0120_2-20121206/35668_1 /TAXON_ID=160619 /ORGANISM="Kryptoperidinium foliaceum, Strain CCMP 1326" /LENGTH=245 /DNA_ID=CAMNT_0017405069 /DNA_START=37 /DNA_END=771 /DNA_ORIENTATION=-
MAAVLGEGGAAQTQLSATSQMRAPPLPTIFSGNLLASDAGPQSHRSSPMRPSTVDACGSQQGLVGALTHAAGGGSRAATAATTPRLMTSRHLDTHTGKRIYPSPIPQWTTNETTFKRGKDLGIGAFGEDYTQLYRGAAGVQSGWPESLPVGPRSYKNPQRSVVDPVVFSRDISCSRDAVLGERTFDRAAAGVQAISSQPARPKPPRAQFSAEGGSFNPHALERRHGGPPAGKNSQDLVTSRLQVW